MDLLSGLPKVILHDIFARLPDKDAAKTIALSKAWRDTWSSFPYLSVSSNDFLATHYSGCSRNSWFHKMDILIDYVTKRLLRLHDQGLTIKEFKLNLRDLIEPTYVSHHVNQWIQMASESGIEVIELYLSVGYIWRKYHVDNSYDLPLCVFENKSLTKLILAFGIRFNHELFSNHSMKFSSLKMLCLVQVLFTEERVIENLLSHCPLIEDFTMAYCYVYNHLSTEDSVEGSMNNGHWVKSLFLHGLKNLKKVDVRGVHQLHIDSPNLENLCYESLVLDAPIQLNFSSCTNFTCFHLLSLKDTTIADKWILELFSKLPFLESLELCHCFLSKRINIISDQLKVLKLCHCSNLNEVNIDAPNLKSLDYHGYDKPVISFMRSSNQLQVSVSTHVDYRYFYSLRDFIRNIPEKISASLSVFVIRPIRDNSYLIPALQFFSNIPPSIKHLELKEHSYPNNKAAYGSLMNWLLSSCFPETFSFRYFDSYAFIEFFHEMLMGNKRGECYCSSYNRKCWWHALKIAKFSCSFMAADEDADFKAMLDASPNSHEEKTITFSFSLEL
ncbi:hypothetical protein PIB30_056959 [Stylosanthes scabra]|uniref:F-box domain-containing protein n=1 Tax=Stylosanthes scabra TaxID=79078 RepID=A0ABU6WL84_9FABA|nr:hypothetical protein [Stylosanthes scabra]